MLSIGSGPASLALDVITARMDGGYLRIYGGERPASPDTPPTGPLLAELRFQPRAFVPAEAGLASAYPLEPEPRARVAGTASWYRCLASDGQSGIVDGRVGLESDPDADIVLDTVEIQQGAPIALTLFRLSFPT
jgi:hypothetical protein